jgi:hypothetical protein
MPKTLDPTVRELAEALAAQRPCLESLAARLEGDRDVYPDDEHAAFAARERLGMIDRALERAGLRVTDAGGVVLRESP